MFIGSLLGVILTMAYTLGAAGSPMPFSTFDIVMTMLLPVALAVFLLWYAKRAENKGWLSQASAAKSSLARQGFRVSPGQFPPSSHSTLTLNDLGRQPCGPLH